MKKFLSIVLVVFIVLLGVAGCSSPETSEPSSIQVPTVFEYQPADPSLDVLRCKGTTIIERCIGLVSNAQTGDAVLLNPPDDCGYYLSYGSCNQEVCNGTILVSYMVYNPNTDYFDDIIERYDFVICRDYEERD